MKHRVLVIEDDTKVSQLISLHLRAMELDIVCVESGTSGVSLAKAEHFALIILDLNLPDGHGVDVCRSLRSQGVPIPILILTSESTEADKVLGLDAGADDYVSKPFSVLELTARVRALLRRAKEQSAPEVTSSVRIIELPGLIIDCEKRKVTRDGVPLDLSPLEFDILYHLAQHPGKPFTREQLLSQIWGYESNAYEGSVSTHIYRLRQKIEPDMRTPTYIKTVWGVGYRFAERDEFS